jgi:hypothetical protein
MKVWFTDFWPNFNGQYFINAIQYALNRTVYLHPNPDILFFSVFGESHKKYKCKKILYTGETRKANDFNLSLTF